MLALKTGAARISQLDGLRAFAVLAVFGSHAFNIRMLWIGVDLFFVLSGFLITGVLLDLKHVDIKSYFWHFYGRRARRILLPYVMLLAVTSVVFGLKWVHHWYMYFGLMNYLVLLPHTKFLPLIPLWLLAVEEQFYLVWPFLAYYVSEKKLPFVLCGLLVLAPALRVLAIPYDSSHQLVYMGTPFRMDCMAMGSLLTFMWRRRSDLIKKYGYLGLLPTALTPFVMIRLSKLGGFSVWDPSWRSHLVTYEVALIAATGVFLWGLGGRFTWILNSAPIQFLGRISYSFYLIHLGSLLYFERYVHSRIEIAGLGMMFSLLYSWASWIWVERPILAGGMKV